MSKNKTKQSADVSLCYFISSSKSLAFRRLRKAVMAILVCQNVWSNRTVVS